MTKIRTCRHGAVLGGLEAYSKATRLKEEGAPGSKGIRARKCRQCKGWFLSTKPRWKNFRSRLDWATRRKA
jgi:hypothetical protein